MKRQTVALFLILFLLLTGAAVTTAQSTNPEVTQFTSTVRTVDRAALAARTARVPVSWVTARRPVFANLFFEQVLPDGGVVNVELPRAIPWVNSSGDGMAAPILPREDATEIILRVRLASVLNGQVFSERQITIPIGNVGGQPPTPGSRPALASFATCCPNVRADQLAAKTARVPVSWTAINRPATANLIFEQVLTDGSVVNVELPRENPWVNSTGDGVAAPVPPGGSATEVNLRVRLVDLLTGRVYDQRNLRIPIGSGSTPAPHILYFLTPVTQVNVNDLARRTARVPVSWSVTNRPSTANLVFEQVLENNTVVNVELPRSNPWVSSEGDGMAAPVLPQSADTILLRVRLVNLADGATLGSREFRLPIQGRYGRVAEATQEAPAATEEPDDAAPPFEVVTFTASAAQGEPGETITVEWEVRNADHVSIGLYLFNADTPDALGENLPASGAMTFTVPTASATGIDGEFRLMAHRAGSANDPVLSRLAFRQECDHDFAFGRHADCVAGEPETVNGAYQPFERGALYWRGDTRQVIALMNDGSALVFTESWTSGDITFEQMPPDGLLLPQQGFGQVWTTSPTLQTALGWATAASQGYSAEFQTGQRVGTAVADVVFFSTPDGRTVRITGSAGTFTWAMVE